MTEQTRVLSLDDLPNHGSATDIPLAGHRHRFIEVDNYGTPTGWYVCEGSWGPGGCIYGYDFDEEWAWFTEVPFLEGTLYLTVRDEHQRVPASESNDG